MAQHAYASDGEHELALRVGEVVFVSVCDDSGWWDGECGGRRGRFPSNYCCVLARRSEITKGTCVFACKFVNACCVMTRAGGAARAVAGAAASFPQNCCLLGNVQVLYVISYYLIFINGVCDGASFLCVCYALYLYCLRY